MQYMSNSTQYMGISLSDILLMKKNTNQCCVSLFVQVI